jgi:8-oxo-dGTP diphosphatase
MTGVDLTADAVATYDDSLVLVGRKTEPQGLALPGGPQEEGETLEAAAVREMREETGLNFVPKYCVGVYDEPGRDPRGEKVSVVYAGEAYGDPGSAEQATDVRTFPLSELEDLSDDLVFDHAEIIDDFLEGNCGEGEKASRGYREPEDLFFLYDRKGSEEFGDFEAQRYGSVLFTDELEDGKRMHGSNADGLLAATVPVGGHPDIGENYIVGARMDETYRKTFYDGSSERRTRTLFPAVEVDESEVQEAVDALAAENPEWIRAGAEIDSLP